MSTRQPANAAIPNSAAPIPSRRASDLSSSFARSTSYLMSCEMSLTASATRSPRDSFVAVAWPPYTVSAILPPFLALGPVSRMTPCGNRLAPHSASTGILRPVSRGALAAVIGPRKPPSWQPSHEWRGKREAGGAPGGPPPETRQARVPKRAPSLPDGPPALSRLRRWVLLGAPASAASRGWSRVGARLPCQDQWSVNSFLRRIGRLGKP